jgi:lysophospholipase L1-like esterase
MKSLCFPALIGALATLFPFSSALSAADQTALELLKGDHIAIVGSGVADRLQHDGWLETLIQKANPQNELVIRNLAFSGDEVVVRLQTDTGGSREQWLSNVKADVVLAFYGFNESFAGPEGLPKFKQELATYLADKAKANYSGKGKPRVVLFSPIAQEKVADPNVPDPTANNKNLQLYTEAMAEVAKANNVPFVDLFAATQKLYASAKQPLTFNGFQLTEAGNKALAPVIYQAVFAAAAPAPNADLEKLRAAVVEKSETWHDRYRTVDSFNIFGGRSKLSYESGKGAEPGKSGPKITNAEVMLEEMAMRRLMTRICRPSDPSKPICLAPSRMVHTFS